MSTSSSNKTKDWLKNQLVSHGVPLPAASAKKEEYQRLYEEQVLPQQSNAEFSSDDDAEPITPTPQPRANSVAKNTKHDSKKIDGESTADKRSAWVQGMSDQNLFDALTSNGRNPGPIVDSTRELYRKMLIDILSEDEHKALSNIEQYLSENKESREHWLENGLDLHGFNGVTNGNTENGFSDTDEDEAIETASRASRSSRASSIRTTPTPLKQVDSAPSTPKSPFESKPLRARPSTSVRSGLNFNDSTDSGVSYHQSEVTASSSRIESSVLYSRISSPGRTPYKPLSATRFGSLNEEDAEDAEEPETTVTRKMSGPAKNSKLFLKSFVLFVCVILLAFLANLYFSQNKSENCQEGVDCPDELDVILKELESNEGVQESEL